jgi:glycosyltransferase involved in cell wall biosynthesis
MKNRRTMHKKPAKPIVSKPTISVIMAAYNDEKYLDESIQSILDQTFVDFEFIIINDASNDSTATIISKHAKKDKRIRVLTNLHNLGITKCLNIGLKVAKGAYIARMDSDDISLPERFEFQVEFLNKHPDIFLVGCGAIDMDADGKVMGHHNPLLNHPEIVGMLMKKSAFYHASIMFRNDHRTTYREKFRFAQDYDLYLCLLTAGKKFANIPQYLFKYRFQSQSISFSKRTKQQMFADQARRFYFERQSKGKDSYDTFSSEAIMNYDMDTCKDKELLRTEVRIHWTVNNFKNVRKYARLFIHHHGVFDKVTLYYIASYLGLPIIKYMRKIKK